LRGKDLSSAFGIFAERDPRLRRTLLLAADERG
jgi:hypothetical protein